MSKYVLGILCFSLSGIMNLYALPTIDFDIKYGNYCENPNTLVLVNKSKEVKQFVWILKLGTEVIATFNTKNPPAYQITKAGNYTILLKGTLNTWEDSISKDLVVKEILQPLPNTITPNNDGKNDTFITNRVGHKFEIFDRWGQILYKSDNYKDDWGKNVSTGTYMYVLTAPTGEKCTGSIMVIK